MKCKFYLPVFFVCLSGLIVFFASCAGDPGSGCPDPIEKVGISNKSVVVLYKGNEHLKFLHNNIDTHEFVAKGLHTFYRMDYEPQSEADCTKDFENIKISFLNTTVGDILTYSFERDRTLFTDFTGPNRYAGRITKYRNITYTNKIKEIRKDSIKINNTYYTNVTMYGLDSTSNFIIFSNAHGYLRLRINDENWDLIP